MRGEAGRTLARVVFRGSALSFALLACAPPPREVKPASDYDERRAPSPSRIEPPSVATGKTPPVRAQTAATSAEKKEAPHLAESRVPEVERRLPELGQFYDAMDALRRGERKASVRVLWLGDSHTAADFMTQPIREHLVRLGGDGGPGFVRLGLDGYRHGAVNVKSFGRWRKAPILPAQRTRVLDGVFGYGGIRTLPAAGGGATASVRESLGRDLVWTLSVRLLHGASVAVEVGDTRTRAAFDGENALAGGAQFVSISGPDTDELKVQHVAGDPEIFGVFADYATPGVVLDTVGINGARTATTLAWEPEQYVAQMRARDPELVVVAFGTNEVFDQTRTDRYVEQTIQLVELVQRARPDVPCWIVGPPDSSTQEGTSKARVSPVTQAQAAAAERVGCAFTSAFELMGGEGSFNRWAREKPARARGDRVHFTIAGYKSLGDLLAASLIGGSPLEAKPLTPVDDAPAVSPPAVSPPADPEEATSPAAGAVSEIPTAP